MVEFQIVDLDVAGSNPVIHLNYQGWKKMGFERFLRPGEAEGFRRANVHGRTFSKNPGLE